MVALAEAGVAGPGLQVFVEPLVPQSHLHVEFNPPGNDPPAGLGAFLPMVHVVLLEGARRAEALDGVLAYRLPDFGKGCFVHVAPRPYFDLVRASRVPNTKGA